MVSMSGAGDVLGCQDLSSGARICFKLPGPAWGYQGSQSTIVHPGGIRFHFGLLGPAQGGGKKGGNQGSGESLSIWGYQEPLLGCQNQLLGCHYPCWGVRAHFGVPEPIFGVPQSILEHQNQFWGTRTHFGVLLPILRCRDPF